MKPFKVMLVALLGAQVFGASGAEDLAISVERSGERFSVRAQATLAVPAELAWQVLTDYESLPRFIPGLTRSKVQQRGANRALLEQKGEARFLFFSFPIEVRVEVRESPHAWITSRAVGGNLKRMQGRYQLEPDGAGVRLSYAGELEPDFDLPPLIGPFVLRMMVEEQFAAMVAEIERRGALAR